MATTVDHLRADQRVRVLQNFTDAEGNRFQQDEVALISRIHLDWHTFVCTIHLKQGDVERALVLHSGRGVNSGPRSGAMREFLAVEAEDVSAPPRRVSVVPQPAPIPEPDQRPAVGPGWFDRALELERQDRLEEAEKWIADAVPNLYYAIATADLYKQRYFRLYHAGDFAGARIAREKACHWAWALASMATSGGEGAALSLERNRFIDSLGPVPDELK